MKKKYEYCIGIDPGVITGFAVWNNPTKHISIVGSASILEVQEDILKTVKEFSCVPILIRFEDARQRTWIPRQKNEKAERGRAQGAGSVKRDCQIWEDFCRMHGIDFEAVPPKNNKTKMSAEAFERLTGWKGRTNEHGRDAAMLVYGL